MSAIGAESLRRLYAASKLAASGPLHKLAAAPIRMAYSKALETWCGARGRVKHRTATTFWGEPMHVVFPDPVSVSIYRYGYFEADLIGVFLRILKPGMTFFDVGSHIGFFSVLALRLVGPEGRVVAFEPTPSTREVLDSNIGKRHNATIVPMAAYRENTTLTFHDFGPQHSAFNSIYSGKIGEQERTAASPRAYQVRATTLDAFVASSGLLPDFLKIDTEGAELDVLAGMESLLAGRGGTKRPALTLEVGDLGGPDMRPSCDVVRAILSKGYAGYEVHDSQLIEHQPRNRYEYTNLLFLPK
jgi:FkbM family methyltransferase